MKLAAISWHSMFRSACGSMINRDARRLAEKSKVAQKPFLSAHCGDRRTVFAEVFALSFTSPSPRDGPFTMLPVGVWERLREQLLEVRCLHE